MADDVGFECFGTYGSRRYSTPSDDKLAGGGVRFPVAIRNRPTHRAG